MNTATPKPPKTTKVGEIQLIVGPMFGEKTTELLRRVNRYKLAKKNCKLVTHRRDSRNKYLITNHDNSLKAVPDFSICDLGDELIDHKELKDVDVIGIDEGQFYKNLVPFCEWAANNGKIVIVAALNGNYKRENFGDVHKLMPKCESISLLSAVCDRCGKDAHFSNRIVKNEKKEFLVGGKDKYEACCRGCYMG